MSGSGIEAKARDFHKLHKDSKVGGRRESLTNNPGDRQNRLAKMMT